MLWYGTIWYGRVCYVMVWYGMVCCDMVLSYLCGIVWHGNILYSMLQSSILYCTVSIYQVWYGIRYVWYYMTWCGIALMHFLLLTVKDNQCKTWVKVS